MLPIEPDSSKTTMTQVSHSAGKVGLSAGVQLPVVWEKVLLVPNKNKKIKNNNSCFFNRLFENK